MEKSGDASPARILDTRIFASIVEESPTSVIITDPRGNIEYVNRKFTTLTGYAREEVLGKNPRLLKSGRQSPSVYQELWRTILAGGEWRGELCNRKKNGELYWELAAISAIRGTMEPSRTSSPSRKTSPTARAWRSSCAGPRLPRKLPTWQKASSWPT